MSQSIDPIGNSAPGNSAPGNSAPGNSAPGNSAPGARIQAPVVRYVYVDPNPNPISLNSNDYLTTSPASQLNPPVGQYFDERQAIDPSTSPASTGNPPSANGLTATGIGTQILQSVAAAVAGAGGAYLGDATANAIYGDNTAGIGASIGNAIGITIGSVVGGALAADATLGIATPLGVSAGAAVGGYLGGIAGGTADAIANLLTGNNPSSRNNSSNNNSPSGQAAANAALAKATAQYQAALANRQRINPTGNQRSANQGASDTPFTGTIGVLYNIIVAGSIDYADGNHELAGIITNDQVATNVRAPINASFSVSGNNIYLDTIAASGNTYQFITTTVHRPPDIKGLNYYLVRADGQPEPSSGSSGNNPFFVPATKAPQVDPNYFPYFPTLQGSPQLEPKAGSGNPRPLLPFADPPPLASAPPLKAAPNPSNANNPTNAAKPNTPQVKSGANPNPLTVLADGSIVNYLSGVNNPANVVTAYTPTVTNNTQANKVTNNANSNPVTANPNPFVITPEGEITNGLTSSAASSQGDRVISSTVQNQVAQPTPPSTGVVSPVTQSDTSSSVIANPNASNTNGLPSTGSSTVNDGNISPANTGINTSISPVSTAPDTPASANSNVINNVNAVQSASSPNATNSPTASQTTPAVPVSTPTPTNPTTSVPSTSTTPTTGVPNSNNTGSADALLILGALGGVATTVLANKDAIQQVFNQTTPTAQQTNATQGVCDAMQPSQCGYEGVKQATTEATQPIANTANANNGLLGQILSAIAALANLVATIWQFLQDKIGAVLKILDNQWIANLLNAVNTAVSVHNALMLSQNVATTLGTIIDQTISFFGFQFKDASGASHTASDVIGHNTQAFLTTIIGADRITQLETDWKIANRIYQTGMNIGSTVQTMVDPVAMQLQNTGVNVANIGNALRDNRVVSPKSYPHLADDPASMRAMSTDRFAQFTSTIQNVDTTVQHLATITGTVQSTAQSVTMLQTEFKTLSDAANVNSATDTQIKNQIKAQVARQATPTEVALASKSQDIKPE